MIVQDGVAHAALRTGTRSPHLATHDLLAMRLLLSDKLDRPTYLKVLCRLWGFVRAVEEIAPLADAIAPARLPDLQADLEWLGMDMSAISGLPICPLPAFVGATPEARLGASYVLQGSRFGGSLISQHLIATLPLGPENVGLERLGIETGAAFFSSRGRPLPSLMAPLLAHLEAELNSEDRRSTSVAAAVATFQAFLAWFDGWDIGLSNPIQEPLPQP